MTELIIEFQRFPLEIRCLFYEIIPFNDGLYKVLPEYRDWISENTVETVCSWEDEHDQWIGGLPASFAPLQPSRCCLSIKIVRNFED